ncbi:two-component system, sensor histidine kinase YesM [Paenibacillus sp. 1_12]|uniref:sensor histidine kinase n=1 Tax=Paenibacillus sp. 1_12 TaxID=1566278 RepID=UPI0008E1873F|nr:histidine kinase [Paenibacillus sp. 1_12]SFL77290.1 two-component system, sensor histidine kinase YesM [Paenibacillus sp. 1_12]
MIKINLSIRTKLIVLFIVFVCMPLLVFGKLWYDKSTLSIERSAADFNEQIVKQANEHLNSYFLDLERTTFPLITHPLIRDFMLLTPEQMYERIMITKKIQDEVLQQLVFGRPEMYSFTIFSNEGFSVSSLGSSLVEKHYETYLNLPGSKNYSVVGIRWNDNIPLLTITRKFKDASTYLTSGVLIIDLRLNEISQIVGQIEIGKTGFLWIADAKGQVIYHPDHAKWGTNVPDWYSEQIQNRESGTFIHSEKEVKDLVVFHKSPYTGWTIISQVPIHEITAEMLSLRNISIWGGLALVLLVILVIGGFSLSLTNALTKLQRLMRQAENGNFNITAPVHQGYEVGNLYRGFNTMVRELRRLIEEVHTSQIRERELIIKQRESTLQALQSQINPHFLYNTLEMINSYAIVEGVTPISRMATALADLFRFSISDSMQIISLKDELMHVRRYLEIQKERFPYLQIEIDMDENAILHINAVRLSLQPLVENSFRHGYEKHRLKPIYVGITGESGNGHYLLRIIDKGRGMDSETMNQYNCFFLNDGSRPIREEEEDEALTRIGLRNVHQRIRLLFGIPYGLQVLQSDEQGSVIQIMLPSDKEKIYEIGEGV